MNLLMDLNGYYSTGITTVDGIWRYPKQPPGIYKTLQIMG